VLRSVINDSHLGKVTILDDGNIDWDTYFQWYNEFVEQERAALAAQRTAPAEDSALIFGGDYPGEEEDVQARTSGSVEVQEGSPEPAVADDPGD